MLADLNKLTEELWEVFKRESPYALDDIDYRYKKGVRGIARHLIEKDTRVSVGYSVEGEPTGQRAK